MSKKMKYAEVRQIVYNRYSGKCAICGKSVTLKEMTIDHITPISRGGDGSFSNMQCTCDSCNLMKHYLTQEEFLKKLFRVTKHNLGNIFKAYVKGSAD